MADYGRVLKSNCRIPVGLPVNPFATRFVAPGRIEWYSQEIQTIESLVQRFLQMRLRAQIVGPHGSGKTTLLHSLVPRLGKISLNLDADGNPRKFDRPRAGETIRPNDQVRLADAKTSSRILNISWLSLRRSHRAINLLPNLVRRMGKDHLLVLDGFEQLRNNQQWWVRLNTWWQGAGLLVTCHQPTGMKTLYHSQLDAKAARAIVGQVWQAATKSSSIPEWLMNLDFSHLLEQYEGNLREVMMRLYDLAEVDRTEAKQVDATQNEAAK